ncbi:MAG: hypothetical protein GY803_15880 [Chloroflexi bacterium]|nr:hypothetical protein [Chloroflexota bacterium]
MSFYWYVLRVKPHKEKSVFRILQSRGLDGYCPVLRVKPKNPRAARERPYFPGYLFVCANLADIGENALSWIPGTHGLVTFGDVPAIVPPNLISEIKKRLAEIEAEGGLILDKLKKGDRIKVVSGFFAGYEAIFDTRLPGDDRAQVLLSFLSRFPQPVKLDITDIEKLE